MMPGRSFYCTYVDGEAKVTFEDSEHQYYRNTCEIFDQLEEALGAADYHKVISLRPALFLINELSPLPTDIFISIIGCIRHHELYRQSLNSEVWCCRLHESIARKIDESIYQQFYYISDLNVFRRCIEYYGKGAKPSIKRKMFVRLCETRLLNVESARALMDRELFYSLEALINDRLHRFLQALFTEVEPKVIMLLLVKVPVGALDEMNDFKYLERADLEDKWWWMIYLYNVNRLDYRQGNAFIEVTSHQAEASESIALKLYRGLLKRIAKCPKALWPYLLPQLKAPLKIVGEVIFDPKLAELLFQSSDSAKIFHVVYEKSALEVLPFIEFPLQYITYGLTMGHYSKMASASYSVFEASRWAVLKKVVERFISAKISNLDEILDYKLTDVFHGRAIAEDDYSFLNRIRCVYDLSVEEWRKVLNETDYIYRLKDKEYLLYLFSCLCICPTEVLNERVELFLNCHIDESYLHEYIQQVFNAENSIQYRILLLNPKKRTLISKLKVSELSSSMLLNQQNISSDFPQTIQELLNRDEFFFAPDGPKWKALISGVPFGKMLHSHLFWSCIVDGFFNGEIRSRQEQEAFCTNFKTEHLFFLKEVFVKALDVWDLIKLGRMEKAEEEFYSYILG